MNQKLTPRRMAMAAMIAALYCAVSLALAPLSFGAVQMRVSEALTMTAIFGPTGILGVTLGCALSNAIGIAMGFNPTGVLDIFFGTAATLIAALMSYGLRNIRFRGLPVAATLPPVIVNAVVIGGELCVLSGVFHPGVYLMNAVAVAAGQVIPCCVLGLLLVSLLERKGLAEKLLRA